MTTTTLALVILSVVAVACIAGLSIVSARLAARRDREYAIMAELLRQQARVIVGERMGNDRFMDDGGVPADPPIGGEPDAREDDQPRRRTPTIPQSPLVARSGMDLGGDQAEYMPRSTM